MKYNLTITEAAEFDIKKSFLWYEEQKENLGFRFEKDISNVFHAIVENPLKIQIRYNCIRVAFLKTFPFGVHFIVVRNEITILAVFHTSMNPTKWIH